MTEYKLLVCTNERFNPKHKSCGGEKSPELIQKLKDLAEANNQKIKLEEIKCFGQCHRAPVMRIAPAENFFYEVKEEGLSEILNKLEALNVNSDL